MTTEEIYDLFLSCGRLFSTDSRAGAGLFFALRGERHDAHDFVANALATGASYAVVERPVEGIAADKLIVVESVEHTLQELARHHRRQFRIPIIAITGTNGKTTTKELLATALGADGGRVLYTIGNLNNHLGVPMTLLRLSANDEMAVIEMGANHPGEIDFLCRIAEPDYGLITNIGMAHLEGFGSPEGVVRTKGELFRYLRETGGTAFYNSSDPVLTKLVANTPGLKTASFSTPETTVLPNGYLVLDVSKQLHPTNLTGAYNASNVAAALAVAAAMGIPQHAALRAICAYAPSNNRSQIIRTVHNTLYMDAYNANPSSMSAALQNFALIPLPQLAILGQMNELGQYSASAHADIVAQADKLRIPVFLVGEHFAPFSSTHHHFATTDDLITYLDENPLHNTNILIKGSNSLRLFTLPERCPQL